MIYYAIYTMYTTSQLIAHITSEFEILKHLWEKIVDEKHLDHQFTPAQRTVKELMAYLWHSIGKQCKLVVLGKEDMSVFADMPDLTKNFDPQNRGAVLDDQLDDMVSGIISLDDAQLAETITLFGQSKPRSEFLINMFVGMLAAYKMQLFLQLKHAGHVDLSSSNLWSGMDKA